MYGGIDANLNGYLLMVANKTITYSKAGFKEEE
jgi:hypothetical protein